MENWRGVFGRTVSELERGTKRRKDCVCLGIACTCRGTVCGEVVRCGRNLDDRLGRRCKWTLQREITEHGILCVNESLPSKDWHPFLPPQTLLIRIWDSPYQVLRKFWASWGKQNSSPFYLHWRILDSTFFNWDMDVGRQAGSQLLSQPWGLGQGDKKHSFPFHSTWKGNMETFNLGYYYKDQTSEVCLSYVQKSSVVQQFLSACYFFLL